MAGNDGGNSLGTKLPSQTKPLQGLDAIMATGLKGASAATNQPSGNLFSDDPFNQYPVYTGGIMHEGMGPMGFDSQSYTDAILAPANSWTAGQVKDFVNKGIMSKIPGFEVGMGMPAIQQAWQKLVQASIVYNQNIKEGQKPWSPMDVMDTYGGKGKFGTQRQGDWIFDVATGERIQYVGPRSKTSKSTQVNLSSPEEVQALVTQTLQQALGRAPTAKELAKFKSTISGYEQAHPQVATTTTTLSDEDIARAQASGGDVWSQAGQQSTTTSGGTSDAARVALVQDPTQDTQEFAKYQGGTTYFNALLQLVGGA
jgi:hypothetical protein